VPYASGLGAGRGGFPPAAARNAGAAAALAAEADVLIFRDVECVPSPPLVDDAKRDRWTSTVVG
jgi:hypothetical protein